MEEYHLLNSEVSKMEFQQTPVLCIDVLVGRKLFVSDSKIADLN